MVCMKLSDQGLFNTRPDEMRLEPNYSSHHRIFFKVLIQWSYQTSILLVTQHISSF